MRPLPTHPITESPGKPPAAKPIKKIKKGSLNKSTLNGNSSISLGGGIEDSYEQIKQKNEQLLKQRMKNIDSLNQKKMQKLNKQISDLDA